MNRIALVVHTCDRYKLLYGGFTYFFKKYWPVGDINISYYFFTEEEGFDSDSFTNIKTGKGEWSDRLLNGLRQIPEDYILYFQEDMWLSKPVNADIVRQLIDFSISQDVKLFKLSSNSVYHNIPIGMYINGLAVATLDNEKSQYLMSHQVSIWNKGFLMDQLKHKEHPWRNERRGTKRLKALNPRIYHVDLFSENEQQPCNNNQDTLSISGYYTVSQNAQLNKYAQPFIEELAASADVTIKNYALKLAHNLENNLTHDGKSQPRKEDWIKKIKNRLLGR